MMKSESRRFYLLAAGAFLCVLVAVGAIIWAASLMGSLFAYRSPLHNNPPSPGDGAGLRSARRVVIVLVDALRVDTSLNPAVMPALNELRERGAWATMHSQPPSYSQSGYATLLTGAGPDIHDAPVVNVAYPEIPTLTQDDIFSAAQRAGLNTAISGYYWFEKLVPQSAVNSSYYTSGEDQFADEQVVAQALEWLETDTYQLLLVHIDQVDYAGHHEGGPRDPHWNIAAGRADSLIRQIASKLDLSQDTLLVVSDHGQIDQGGHGGDEAIVLSEPFVLVGAAVKPGNYGDIQMVDIAPTLAAILGVNIPASSQGHALLYMLDFIPEQVQRFNELSHTQQELLINVYAHAISQGVEVPESPTLTDYQEAMEATRTDRLKRERQPRLILAILFGIISFAIVYVLRDKGVLWLVGDALLYTLLFHLFYAIWFGKSYSLSWITGAEEFVGTLFIAVALAFGTSWLVLVFGIKTYRFTSIDAAGSVIGLTLCTLYLTALPLLLHFVLNGALVTWRLPHFRITFLALLSMIQIAIVALVGPIMAGITGLFAWITRSRIEKRHSQVVC